LECVGAEMADAPSHWTATAKKEIFSFMMGEWSWMER
jgi:hypothetical protein